jgi:CDP-glycerol glycerophosphotransferase
MTGDRAAIVVSAIDVSAIDVSIVLITFNDARRLPRALSSLTRQTLRNLEIIVVDDASTDDTADVVAQAMETDSRIRYVRLDTNSGGCSAPRNRGIREARGTWVMFCDSDDEFERHAAKNLLLVTERADADLGCGVVERVDANSGKSKRWRADLHEPAVLASIDDRPDLIADTVSVNKIYRRSWLVERGIDFPEGILYEDQLFTLKAFAEARRICVITETVYFWYVERIGSDLSITQRRHEVRNVRSRVEVNRQIDDYLGARGLHDLARTKTRKFLSHDLYLYLSTLLELDDAGAHAVAAELAPYVATLDLAEASCQRPALRVATYHLLIGDLDGLRRAMRFIRWSAVVDAPIVIRSDAEGGSVSVSWGCEHLDSGPEFQGLGPQWWLDVTALGLDRATASQRRWCHRLTSLEAGPGGWVATGCTVDAFGGLGRATSAELVLVLGAQVLASILLEVSRPGFGAEWQWRTTGSHPVGVGTGIRSGDRGFLAVRLTIDGVVNVMPVRVPESAAPLRILRGPKAFVGVRTYPGEHGVVRWHAGRSSTTERFVGRLRQWWSALGVPVMRMLRAGARRLGERLPPSPSAVFIGTGDVPGSFSGQAQAISVALRERRPDIEQAWLGATSSGALTVRRAWRLARARWWVLDVPLPAAIRPPAHVRMLATQVAVPIVRTGVDDPDWDIASAAQRKAASALPRRWDARHAAGADTARAHLDLPADRVNVVYAPLGDACLIGLEQFVAELGDRVHLAIASGSGRAVDIPSVLRHSVRDVSAGNAREFAYAASDVLITDFSPVMVDFALAERPVVIFAPHFDTFVARTKGTYVDLEEAGPGPITRTMSELIAAMTDLLDHELRVAEPYRERSMRLGDGPPTVMSPHEFVAEMLGEA